MKRIAPVGREEAEIGPKEDQRRALAAALDGAPYRPDLLLSLALFHHRSSGVPG